MRIHTNVSTLVVETKKQQMRSIRKVEKVARSSIVVCTNVKLWRKILEDKNSTTKKNAGFKRVSIFLRKYSPLCGSIAQHLFPKYTSQKVMIAMIYLQELPEDCTLPRMDIESAGRVDIKDIPGDFGTQCLESVNQERK